MRWKDAPGRFARQGAAAGRRVRTLATPASMRTLPAAGVGVAVDRMVRSGDRQGALRFTALLRDQFPASPLLLRLRVRALLIDPLRADDVAEAAAVAELNLSVRDDADARATFIDALIATHRIGADGDQLVETLRGFAAVAPERRAHAVRRFVVFLLAAGDHDLAVRASSAVARTCAGEYAYTELALQTALRCERREVAAELEATVDAWAPEERSLLRTATLLRDHNAVDARRVLEATAPSRSAAFSATYVTVLQRIGDPDGVLEYLDGTDHGLAAEAVDASRFDALFSLGRLADAVAIADRTARRNVLPSTANFLQLRDAYARDGDAANERAEAAVRRWEANLPVSTPVVNGLIGCYFELGLLADVERLATRAPTSTRMGPSATYGFAKALYALRRFDEAERLLRELAGSGLHAEAGWLGGRIRFERGDDAGALADRAATAADSEQLDEVSYYALLNQGRLAEAFARYSPPADRRRLQAIVGSERADLGPEFGRVGTRVVLVQNGPGDEIQLCGAYHALAPLSDELVVLGDPRLTSLMQRSFPTVRFRPTRRAASRRDFGFLAPAEPPRAPNELYELVGRDDMEVLDAADRVVLGRALQSISLQRPSRGAVLRPDPATLAAVGRRIEGARGGRGLVGLCWRSEFATPLRDIHYLTVDDVLPLLEIDATVVCLQYDASPSERRALEQHAPGRVVFLDDVDLRDDFEVAAALVSSLDVVVGIGTTMVELAGAVGTPTVLMQPTRFGAWRAIDEGATDYWHESIRVAQVDRYDDRPECVRRAAKYIDEALGERRRR